MKKVNIISLVYPVISLCIIAILWSIMYKVIGEPIILPSIGQTFDALFKLFSTEKFYIAISNTLLRTFASYFISLILAIIFSILASIYNPIEKLMNPFVVIFKVVPTMSVILLSILWVNSFMTPILVSFIIIFPLLYTSFLDSIKGVDKKLVEMAKIYNVSKTKIIKSLYIPEIMPSFFTALRNTLSLNLKLIIASEVMAQTARSIGIYMQEAKMYIETAELLAWTITAILIGALFELIILVIQKLVIGRKI